MTRRSFLRGFMVTATSPRAVADAAVAVKVASDAKDAVMESDRKFMAAVTALFPPAAARKPGEDTEVPA